MLVIRRQPGDSILIGDGIEVQVIECSPTRVKLGIVAPPEVAILRKEVLLTRQQNRMAAESVMLEQWQRVVRQLRPEQ